MRNWKKGICLVLTGALVFGVLTALTSVSADVVLYGDCDANGIIHTRDSLVLRQYIAKYDVDIDLKAADVCYDGKINSRDSLVLRQYLADYDVKLGPTTTAPVEGTEIYTVDEMLASSNLIGRSVVEDGVLKMEHTTSGIEFMADCEGDIVFTVTCSGADGGYMGVMIDDDFENMIRVTLDGGTMFYSAGVNLPKGVHKIRLIKLNEWMRNTMELQSVMIEGTLTGAKPQEKELKLEFYGDSLTVGYGNLTTGTDKGGWQWQDGYRTYAAYCANELGAEFSTVAASGHGVTAGFSDKSQTWDKFAGYSLVSSQTPWDFDAYQADVVVVNLGANDETYYNRAQNPAISDADFKAACQTFLDWIRSNNPDCEIVWALGSHSVSDSEKIKPIKVLKELDAELDYLHFTQLDLKLSGGDSHPSVADHQEAGLELAQYLKNEILN